jgi:hypothetical protein
MSFGRKHIIAAMRSIALCSAWLMTLVMAAHADLGDRVSNVASISQDTPNGTLVIATNDASFVIEAKRTPSDVEFFRVVQTAPDAISVRLNGCDFSPSGALNGPFSAFDEVVLLQQKPLDTTAPANLVSAETYLPGELIVVRVVDTGQNGNSDVIETVAIRVTADNGDRITLRLYEDTPNSGHFYGFFPSSPGRTESDDRTLTAPQDTVLTATYIDAFDATEVSVDTALVDPFGSVFDSYTGDPINNVRVSILDVETGLPATILGIDGTGAYPAQVETGQSVSDSNGIAYPAGQGTFFFPIVAPGQYRLVIDAPECYVFPSARSEAELQALATGPYELWADASYGEVFDVTSTGPLKIDIPIDPAGDLTIRKRASDPQRPSVTLSAIRSPLKIPARFQRHSP